MDDKDRLNEASKKTLERAEKTRKQAEEAINRLWNRNKKK